MSPIAYLGPQQLTDAQLAEIAAFVQRPHLGESEWRTVDQAVGYTRALLDDLLRARTALAEAKHTHPTDGQIARIVVQRGPLTEYPIAQRTDRGWQNGVTHYPDTDVIGIQSTYGPIAPLPDNIRHWYSWLCAACHTHSDERWATPALAEQDLTEHYAESHD
jgi:hypothetical protein